MSNLNSNFDILRGWPNGCALWYEFKQKDGVTPNIDEGTIVDVEAGTIPGKPVVDRYESALPASGNLDNPWLVIQGRDQYDGRFTGTLSCIKLHTGVVFKIPTILAMVVGDRVWSDANGKLTNVDPTGGVPDMGKVIQVDSVNGWIVVES